ncbi:MAG: Omp28-related outer membrane protein [Muribaculaceae bacterium]|nr:Omp28-related outer membrane protein [Muribaculaceae bacterium]
MKKHLLTLLIAGAASTGVWAENATLDYTYANESLFLYGKGKKELIDVAICINNPGLAGKKITGIKAYISTAEGIEQTSVWLSNELTLENKVNVPDIASFDVTPAAVTVGEYDLQVLEANLSEPYTLTADPVYVGYSLSVVSNSTDQQKNPIVLSSGTNSNGFWLHMKQSVLKWMDYSANAKGVAFIVAEIEGEYPDYSLGLQGYKPIYCQSGQAFSVDFNAVNIGANPINEVSYVYSFDGGAQQTGTLSLPSPIDPQLALTSPLSLNFQGVEGMGSHTLQVEITEVNGQPNDSSIASIECTVNVIPFVPQHKPLVEEYTGLWCGWCTRGYLAMEMIGEIYGNNAVAIAYHNGDPMEVTQNYPVRVPGYPSASVNRNPAVDPYYGSDDVTEFGISNDIAASIDEMTVGEINLRATLSEGIITVESATRFIQDFTNANYEVGYVLVSNGLTNPTWAQANYYSGAGGYEGSYLQELTEWPDPVAGLVFNDVAIDVSAMNGIANSIPASITNGQEYPNTFTFNIIGNELVQNTDNLIVAAFVIDKTTGLIVNANKCDLSGNAGVESIKKGNSEVIKIEYYDLTGRKVAEPHNGVVIKREIMNDGSSKSSKIIVR